MPPILTPHHKYNTPRKKKNTGDPTGDAIPSDETERNENGNSTEQTGNNEEDSPRRNRGDPRLHGKEPKNELQRIILTTPVEAWPPPYYFENGLRCIKPYHWTYNTYCKERWRGRELIEVFESEFRDRPLSYYKYAIERGNVRINGEPTTASTIVRNGDIVSHTLHRHEPPVTAEDVAIIHEDSDIIVISKPAGVPVHPAGRYNYNSVNQIMRAERGYSWAAMPCNRLDRLTSGIMFFGKSKRGAESIGEQIRSRAVKKEYIARVVGEFPEGEVVCEQPLLNISPKLGLNRVRANGKEARTVFRRLAYYPGKDSDIPDEAGSVTGNLEIGDAVEDGSREDTSKVETSKTETLKAETLKAETRQPEKKNEEHKGLPWKKKTGYSIVRCMPLTGRTHQIRVHLQFLGHPISNDPIYCNQKVFGQDLGRGDADGDRDEDIMSRLAKMGKEEVADAVAYHDEMVDEFNRRKAERLTGELCEICDTPLYSDPGEHELGIYLHAKRYACAEAGWEYSTPLPKWALPPEGVEGPRDTDAATDPLAADIEKLGLNEEGDAAHTVQEPLATAAAG